MRGGILQIEPIADRSVADRPEAGAKPSLCVVNYNGARFLSRTLEAALGDAKGVAEILLVDNGSEDESLAIAARYPGVRIVALGENRGASAVRNAALREAASDLVMLVDSDVIVAPGCADLLARALREHPRAAVAMPRVLYDHDRTRVQYDGADAHFLGLQIIRRRDRTDAEVPEDTRPIGSVITACCLVDRCRVGRDPFDENFFIYFEDHDFGVRVRARGFDILSVGAARCYHREGTPGLSIRALGKYSPLRVYCVIRNRWQFIAKNYSARTLLLLSPLLLLYEAAQLAAVVKKGWLAEWGRAAGWMVRHGPEVLRRRREVQAARRRPDSALLTTGRIPFRDELIVSALERKARGVLESITAAYWRRAGRLV